ncbi:MAG: MaoC family dehydratase [Anaerolineae bacterium]|nr:MAG: MaoC family dehydratase [Anaerolineae bacterium]
MTYEPGASASRTKTFTDEDVRTFAHLTGDTNPVHLDADYAATTVFGQRIVHGILTSALISAVLANDLPGPGTIYLGQNLKFKKPVFIGDTITATVTISQVRAERKIITFETTCTNQNGEVVIEGEATVKAP